MASTTPCRTPDLRQFTGYLLRRAYVKSAGTARACIPDDAHMREVLVLSILTQREALSQRELGDAMHVNRSQVVTLVDGLEGKSWVRRERGTRDRRAYALRVTSGGEAALAGLTLAIDRAETALTEGLTVEEIERLNGHLRALLAGDEALQPHALVGMTSYLIGQAHRRSRGWAQRGLAHLGLHPRDFGLLMTLGREQPCSQNHLASILGVSPPAVQALLHEMGVRGFVSRVRNIEDRRVLDVSLTAEGQRTLGLAQRAASAAQSEAVARLGVEGDADLRALLIKLTG